MVTKIRYKLLTEGCTPVINDNGNAFDLVAAKDMTLESPRLRGIKGDSGEIIKAGFHSAVIPLGIIMELPEGFKADLKPRSSSYQKWFIIQPNSPGLIDQTFCGDIPNDKGKVDEWGMPVIAMATSHIKKGNRVCQFEIRPTMTATIWQKLRWLLTTRYEFVQVESLGHVARGGFGNGTKHLDANK